jgi:hypothetical protein
MTETAAGESLRRMLDPPGGFSRTGKVDRAGVETVIALRRKYGKPNARLGNPDSYIQDLAPARL